MRQITTSVAQHAGNRKYAWAVLGLVVLAAFVRLSFICQPIRYDEAYAFLRFASRPVQVVVSDYHYPNNHVFHTLLVHVAYRVLGDQPWAVRVPAFIAGVLIVPACYLAASLYSGKAPALLSAGLLAPSSILVEYSTNARGYTLICLISLVLLALGLHLKRGKSLKGWLLFGVLSAIGFYTIPVMLYPFGAVVAWLIASSVVKDAGPAYGSAFPRYLGLAVGLALLLTVVLYVPIFLVSGVDSVVANSFVIPLAWTDFVSRLPGSLLSAWKQWTRDVPLVVSVGLVVALVASLLLHNELHHDRVPLLLPAAIWCGAALLVQRVVPFPRVWLFLLPLFVMAASAGMVGLVARLGGRVGRANDSAFVGAVLLLSVILSVVTIRSPAIYESTETGTLRSAEEITLMLKEELQPGDLVVASVPSDYPLLYYFRRHGVSGEYMTSSTFDRAFVVVNEAHGQTLEGVVEREGLSRVVNLASARTVSQVEAATLYEVKRLSKLGARRELADLAKLQVDVDQSYYGLGQYESAMAAFRQALAVPPTNHPATDGPEQGLGSLETPRRDTR